MGLFDKKFCDICGEKVSMLTQQKLSDGFLCSDCKHKLGAFTSGWKQRTVEDVKKHLALREQNKEKYQQFKCSASVGGSDSSIQVDFTNRWFIFDVNNRDNKNGNPQVFDFTQLQDYWLEQEYRTLTDSDQDGIPDIRDNFDNRQLTNQGNGNKVFINVGSPMFNNMQTCMLNVPLAAQPFVRNAGSGYSSSTGIKEVSGIKACFKVTDPYITNDITFTVAYVASNNQMQLMQAYDLGVQVMQLCEKITQNGSAIFAASAPQTREEKIMERVIKENTWTCPSCKLPNIGTTTCTHCGKPVADEEVIALAKYVAKCEIYSDDLAKQADFVRMQKGNAQQSDQQPMQQGYGQQQQPVQNAAWFCPSCGTQNTSKFCTGCGTPKP